MLPREGDYLVSYDIACRKRWRRVFRLLHGYGERVQLSVFRCRLDPRRHARLVAELHRWIDPDEDRLLVARLAEGGSRSAAAEGREPRARGRALIL